MAMPAGEMERVDKWVPAFAGMTKIGSQLVALALLLILATLPVRAAELAEAVAGLGGDGFAAKEKAIIALAKTGDPKAVPILQALGGDRLRAAPDGRVILMATTGGTTQLFDAA